MTPFHLSILLDNGTVMASIGYVSVAYLILASSEVASMAADGVANGCVY